MCRRIHADMLTLHLFSQALPSERKVDQHYVDTLVKSTELCLLSAEMVARRLDFVSAAVFLDSDWLCSRQRPDDFDKNASQIRFIFSDEGKADASGPESTEGSEQDKLAANK
jgi:hypothetical protein